MILNQKLDRYKIILASKSPRRQHLIGELGIAFEVRLNGDTDESYPSDLSFNEIPIYLAQKKAEPLIGNLSANEILITSDTIVWCDNTIVGKPADRSDAIRILEQLSGKKHVVVTGVKLTSGIKSRTFSAHTDVYFRKLTHEEIEYYVDTFKPFDKAGAYGIQEWIGYVGVERIEGSYFNVMGRPVQKLYMELSGFIDELENN
jgi:septum formation protein